MFELEKKLNPKTIANEAPNPAAEEIPVVKGLTIGFPVIPCIIDPATANPLPARIANKVLGNLRLKIIFSACANSLPFNAFIIVSSTIDIVEFVTPRELV